MTKVTLSADATADLQATRHYISSVLSNPSASRQTLKRIATQLHTLEQFPEAGTPILIPGSPVAYRYLVCGSYIQEVDICRIDCFVIIRFAAGLSIVRPAASTGRKDERS